jgi:murein DD-endopeptidase MepM/ murein hydrolase activator NlpD
LFEPGVVQTGTTVAATAVALAPTRSKSPGESGRWLGILDLSRFDRGRFNLAALNDLDLSVDLGDRIGTREWWIGAATIAALCAMALVAGVQIPSLPLPARAPLTATQQENAAPDAFSPLARGAATGRFTPPSKMVEPLKEAPERPRVETTVRLNGGDSLGRVLRRGGVGPDDAEVVTRMLSGIVNPGAIKGGTAVDLVLGRRETKAVPRPLESMGLRAAFDLRVEITRDADGKLLLKRIPIAVDNTPLRISGTVGGSLARAARAAGVPARVVADYIQNMSYVIDFQRQVGAKDHYDIVVEHRRAETGETETGGLIYASLLPKKGERIDLMRWTYGGKTMFFRGNGESAKKGLMRTPVDGAHLTSDFGMRFHPILNYSRLHQGVDFGAAYGSPVMAAAAGTISFAGVHGGHGNYIMLVHRPGLATAYAHLSRFAVHVGQQVAQGQVIGYVGSTGLSTGPHLHYEVWLNNQPVNPLQVKFLGGTQLAGSDLVKFKSALGHMQGLNAAGSMTDDDSVASAVPVTKRSVPDVDQAPVATPPAKAHPATKTEAKGKTHKEKPAKTETTGKSSKKSATAKADAKTKAKASPKAKTTSKDKHAAKPAPKAEHPSHAKHAPKKAH